MVNVSLFGQILTRLDRYSFKKIVTDHQSDKHSWLFRSKHKRIYYYNNVA